MKKIYYIVFAILVSGLLDACIHDDTSLADPDFSRLSIISQYDTLSVNLSEEFVYKVDVVQSGEDRPFTSGGMRPIIPRMRVIIRQRIL